MVRTANTNSTSSSPGKNTDNEWTTVPVKPKLLVSFPRYPAQPTLHMLLLNSYFPMSTNKWIWHCYLDYEVLSPNPRGRERYMRIQKAFTKSGNFFAERGIVLHSLNISTSRIAELFFGSEEDLWKADALVEEYSRAMTGVGDRIRRKENTGKMVCHGVHFLEQFTGEFIGRWNLKEERLRELEDMNPVFYSNDKRVLYRIRYVHYMSSQSSSSKLSRHGATWAVSFSDFRVAECFIDGHAKFNFFMDPCDGGLTWYHENPSRFIPNPSGFKNGGVCVSGAATSSNTTPVVAPSGADELIEKELRGLAITKNHEEDVSALNAEVSITEQNKPKSQILTNPPKQAKNSGDSKLTKAEQEESKFHPITTAATDGAEQAAVVTSETQISTDTITKHSPKPGVATANTTEQQKPQPFEHLAGATMTPSPAPTNPEAINIKEYRRAKLKEQPPRDERSEFPPLPPPQNTLLSPSPPPAQSSLPIREPASAKIPSSSLPDTPNKSPPLETSTTKGKDARPRPPQNVKYQYPINRKRSATKVTPQTKESTSGKSGDSNCIPATSTAGLAGQATTKQPNLHNQQNSSQDNGASDNAPITASAASAPGVDIATGGGGTTTANDAPKPGTENPPEQEVLEKLRFKRAAAKKRRMERRRAEKKAGASAVAGAIGEGGAERVQAVPVIALN
ncbi:hypothetical protein HOY82DRAFT_589751 [Tuber indicum]|nr:hypothetical protein HOY82DRAFT_589751 [Tuber indicum]